MWTKSHSWSRLISDGMSLVGNWRTSGARNSISDEHQSRIERRPSLLQKRFAALTCDDETSMLVRRMLEQNRYALLLRPQIASTLSPEQRDAAREIFAAQMSRVPAGDVLIRNWHSSDEDEEANSPSTEQQTVCIAAVYLDRFAVTNRQYAEFVAAGGYRDHGLWEHDAWPAVPEFVDRTGQPGPRYWRDGIFESGLEDHPVVGVCWHEAHAYARWTGKRLPTDAEWVKGASWPITQPNSLPIQRRFPWGDSMDRRLANVWGTGPGKTVPVDEFEAGVSIGGIYQMIGNVWEWMVNDFDIDRQSTDAARATGSLKSIRGGAFDTYCDSQANCDFASGEGIFARKHNLGFRLAIGECDVLSQAESQDFDADSPESAELRS